MRSFRQYLAESHSHKFDFTIFCDLNMRMDTKTFDAIAEVVSTELKIPRHYIQQSNSQNDFKIHYDSLPIGKCSRDDLDNLYVTSVDEWNHEMAKRREPNSLREYELSDSRAILVSEGVPPVPMDWSDIVINLRKGDDLRGIEKLVSSADAVSFDNCESVETGVLNFFKIPKKVMVYLDGDTPWTKIVFDHLFGERDMLACKEELMEKGLKQYAKL